MARSVDWTAIEKLLVDQATTRLTAFAAAHPDEVFYGAIVDVEPYDGCSVRIHLNTEANLTKEYDGKPVPADDLFSRFLPGSFAYSLELSDSDKFPATAIEEMVEIDLEDADVDDDDPKTATYKLLEIACNVAFALEHGALTKLKRTDDFAFAVTRDPREPGEFSVARYAKFKKQLKAIRHSNPALIPKPKPGI
ncbi:MAG: hypothetical protein H0V17_33865 [Deltaproteobacteria bacterium]|nr:hypothetical protein [Deltaproteobacteria bacterium]